MLERRHEHRSDWDLAVLFRPAELHPGDRIRVPPRGRHTAVFQVTSLDAYRKDDFPSATVFGHADRPLLRLVACARADSAGEDYPAAWVVRAELLWIEPDPPG